MHSCGASDSDDYAELVACVCINYYYCVSAFVLKSTHF